MRKILFILLIFLPFITKAQNDKYLEGAIPVIDGKIVFNTEIKAPSMQKGELYNIMLKWAQNKFKPNEPLNSSVVYKSEKDGIIAARGEEYIIFSSSAFSLDRTRIYYILSITCNDGSVKLGMDRINYLYDEARNGGIKYKAEEWINDKCALNKSKTKLAPISGKFRSRTIDLKDAIFKAVKDTIGEVLMSKGESGISQKNTTVENKQLQTNNNIALSTDNIIKSSTRLNLSVGENENIEIDKNSWGGFGELFGKKVAFIILNKTKTIANMVLNQNDKYKILFYLPESSSPKYTINCKKLFNKEISNEEIEKFNLSNKDGSSYNLYVGEIIE